GGSSGRERLSPVAKAVSRSAPAARASRSPLPPRTAVRWRSARGQGRGRRANPGRWILRRTATTPTGQRAGRGGTSRATPRRVPTQAWPPPGEPRASPQPTAGTGGGRALSPRPGHPARPLRGRLAHGPADLGAQAQRLRFLAYPHETAQELHAERA